MSMALGIIGMLILAISIIMLIVNTIRKSRLRTWGIIAAVGLVFFIVGVSLSGPPTPTSLPTPSPTEQPVSEPDPEPESYPMPEPTPIPEAEVNYTVVEVKDVSFANTIRKSVRVATDEDLTEEEIEWVASDVVKNIINRERVNAIMVFIYRYNDDYYGGARFAVDWAPYGDWSQAMEVKTGEYKYHQYRYREILGWGWLPTGPLLEPTPPEEPTPTPELTPEPESYPMVKVSSYPAGSAERAFVEFLTAWKDEDWNRMAESTQITWRSDEENAAELLWAQYGFKDLLGAEIVKISEVSDCCVDITATIYYEFRHIERKNITARVICEMASYEPDPEGEWGVNPISTLKEE